MSVAVADSEKIMLAEMSLETELRIQEMTTLLFLIHELSKGKLDESGLGSEPSMNPYLFLIERAIIIARLHEA